MIKDPWKEAFLSSNIKYMLIAGKRCRSAESGRQDQRGAQQIKNAMSIFR
jgi:hypothetical protein